MRSAAFCMVSSFCIQLKVRLHVFGLLFQLFKIDNYRMTYWMLDAACFVVSCYCATVSLITGQLAAASLALICLWVYPLALEAALNLMAKLQYPFSKYYTSPRSHFIYDPDYNMTLLGLERSHPIDSQKYAKVYEQLIKNGIILPGDQIKPLTPPRSFLLEKMRKSYLLQLSYGYAIARILELPYWWVPGWIYRWKVLEPMLLATGGSILAAQAALQVGWVVNLSGGYHHASYDRGEGFCIYPDISMMVHYLQTRLRIRRIMIVDLDAHQGNGFERDLIINEDVYIVDCYDSQLFPQDSESKDAIAKVLQISSETTDGEYLKMLDSLKQDFDYWRPEFVIYNAGTDVLSGDPLGQLGMMRQTVIKRDEKVVGMSRQRGVPIAMLLSGGYQSASAEVIAASLVNLQEKFG